MKGIRLFISNLAQAAKVLLFSGESTNNVLITILHLNACSAKSHLESSASEERESMTDRFSSRRTTIHRQDELYFFDKVVTPSRFAKSFKTCSTVVSLERIISTWASRVTTSRSQTFESSISARAVTLSEKAMSQVFSSRPGIISSVSTALNQFRQKEKPMASCTYHGLHATVRRCAVK
jgi:hypothetical protein